MQAIRNVLAEKNQGEGFFKSQRLKQRKSLGRRVSFAPDAHLETTHLYPQVNEIWATEVVLNLPAASFQGIQWKLDIGDINFLFSLDKSFQVCSVAILIQHIVAQTNSSFLGS